MMAYIDQISRCALTPISPETGIPGDLP